MNKENEPIKEPTTLSEIKRCIDEVDIKIWEEIKRTNQSWFPCFRTTLWKVLPTLFDTAKLKGEITEEEEKKAKEEIGAILEKTSEYEKKSGGSNLYEEGVPSDEIKQELLIRLRKILE